jgi:hypothetical protein
LYLLFAAAFLWRGIEGILPIYRASPTPQKKLFRDTAVYLFLGMVLLTTSVRQLTSDVFQKLRPQPALAHKAILQVTNADYYVHIIRWERTPELNGTPVNDPRWMWLLIMFESDDPVLAHDSLGADFARCGLIHAASQEWKAHGISADGTGCLFVIDTNASGLEWHLDGYPVLSLGY